MYNILIVDDEPAVLEGFSLILDFKDYGFTTVDFAVDGEAALEKMKKTKYNLLITDIRMPAMDGLQLIATQKKLNPETKTIILSGYNEFSYAKKGIEFGVLGYLLKPVSRDELIEYLVKIKNLLDAEFEEKLKKRTNLSIARDRFYFDLSKGHLSEKEISEKATEFQFDKKVDYGIALIEICDFYKVVEVNLEQASLLKFSVRNIVEEIVNERALGYVYEDVEGLLGIILCKKDSELTDIVVYDCFSHICACIEKYLGIKTSVSYGDFVKSVFKLKTCHKQAHFAMERSFISKYKNIVSYSQVKSEESSLWKIVWDSQYLVDAIENMDFRAMEKEIDKLADEILQKIIPNNTVLMILQNLIYTLCAIIKRNNGQVEMFLNNTGLQNILNNRFDMETLKPCMSSACSKASVCISDLKKSKSESVINRIKRYIDDNYTRDISIKEISGIFYLNSAYLGQLFKNTVGDTFNDYIHKKRISEIKKMLVSEDLKVHEVLEKAGYSNQGYFYRKFKYYEGISFADYNESLKKKRKEITLH